MHNGPSHHDACYMCKRKPEGLKGLVACGTCVHVNTHAHVSQLSRAALHVLPFSSPPAALLTGTTSLLPFINSACHYGRLVGLLLVTAATVCSVAGSHKLSQLSQMQAVLPFCSCGWSCYPLRLCVATAGR